MVEAGAQQVSEEQILSALSAGHEAIRQIIDEIDKLAIAVGKPKLAVETKKIDAAFGKKFEEQVLSPLTDAMRIPDKLENYAAVDRVLDDYLASLPERVGVDVDPHRSVPFHLAKLFGHHSEGES